MDVTTQILAHNNTYGASDNTAAYTLSASKSLNYADGASITKPAKEHLSVIPFTFKYEDAVGLFGAENKFIRFDVNVDTDYSNDCFEEPFWTCAKITPLEPDEYIFWYEDAVIDYQADTQVVNDYEPANFKDGGVPNVFDPYISVDLKNLKVGNIYIDDHLDVRLYTKDRQLHDDDFMYIRPRDHFYLGIHARETRRLPYNLELTIGAELRSGLPSTECNDEWEVITPDCLCVEEEWWVCAEMSLYKEHGTDYEHAEVDYQKDPNAVNEWRPARVFLQGGECIPDHLADAINFPRRGRAGKPPEPQAKKVPCCASC